MRRCAQQAVAAWGRRHVCNTSAGQLLQQADWCAGPLPLARFDVMAATQVDSIGVVLKDVVQVVQKILQQQQQQQQQLSRQRLATGSQQGGGWLSRGCRGNAGPGTP